MQTTTTLYQAYKKKGVLLNRKQYLHVGLQAKQLYFQIFGELPPKIEQQEPMSLNYAGKNPKLVTFQVFTYPAEFEPIIHNLIDQEAKKQPATKNKPVAA